MDRREYEIMYRAEDSHWWYRGMAEITRALIETYYPRGGHLRILDAGCGTGAGMSLLADYGKVTGFDISPAAVQLCRLRHREKIVRASVMALPYPNETFDLVTSFDVLYFRNVQDEVALRETGRILKPGGRIILRVPAFKWLRGTHDRRVSTGHRYTLRELSGKMEGNGLKPVWLSYANAVLFPAVFLKRLWDRWFPFQKDSDIAINAGCLGGILETCLRMESRLLRRRTLPFGVSLLAVGEKPIA